ncbi:fatty acid desaturase [Rhizobium sp. BT-175]|uniref:fatty acid desaturase n=1 Tax=Rhizobium sp. BT-175 TaxID=2986929 RepID=UPI002236AA65|nr:fatty acid desaturase [Rhizobium sp. BT-175]MCV9947653.1 hypothetical protein [Rhizobium sp. BT-175]
MQRTSILHSTGYTEQENLALARGQRTNPRETMVVLPRFLQPFLTWVTGMPFAGQRQIIRWTPWTLVLCTVCEIALGVVVGAAALSHSVMLAICLLPVSWILTTGGIRMFFVVIEHTCTHHIFSRTRWVNEAVAEIISVVFWTQHYAAFKSEHATHHRVTRMAADPDTHFLNEWGFAAGMPKEAVIRKILATLVSPKYHIVTFLERLKYSISGARIKKLASPLFVIGMVFVVYQLDILMYWLILWILPVTILFQCSMLLNILTEHRWPQDAAKRDLQEVCYGRFCGEPTPDTDGLPFHSRALLWGKWWFRLVFIFLPYRLFVLVGDEPHHDFHHRQPNSDWANASYARHEALARSRTDKYGEYTDEWGSLLDHIYASSSPRNIHAT